MDCSQHKYTLSNDKQAGLSLIELMIAMALSLFLMMAVYKVFDMQQNSFRLVSSLNDREDNAQLGLKILADAIRMADYWGGVETTQLIQIPDVQVQNSAYTHILSAAPGDCNENWVFDTSKGVYGVEGKAAVSQLGTLPTKCLKNKHYLADSDLISLRFADSRNVFRESEIDNKRYQKHYFLRSQTGKASVLFQGAQLNQAVQKIPDQGFHYNMLFHSSLFFLRPCLLASSSCLAGDAVLTRLTLMGDRYIQEALVEGIEQMQFEYGVDENKDKRVDKYVDASKVMQWQDVLSVKVFLLVKTSFKDMTLDEKGKRYPMNSAASNSGSTYQVPEIARHYPRRLYQTEVALRNRLTH